MTTTPLRKARQQAGVSLRDMADRLEADRGKLSRVETGKGKLTMTTIRDTAILYEIELGLDPYTLVRECKALPANLEARMSALPGLLSRLRLTPDIPSLHVTVPAPRSLSVA